MRTQKIQTSMVQVLLKHNPKASLYHCHNCSLTYMYMVQQKNITSC